MIETTAQQKLLELPELQTKETAKRKRFVANPDVSMLKEKQKEAYDDLLEFVGSEGGGMRLVKGYAGTGKSYLVSKLVERILHHYTRMLVGMTAPTNKAVKVLKRMAEYQDTNLHYATIHSMLGLIRKINSYNGTEYFARDFKRDSFPIEDLDLVIIDEVSMLNDELFGYLEEYVSAGLKIIFVGDPCQIPPVNKEDCIPFQEEEQEEYGIAVSELSEIVRQAADNPIIKVTLKIRKALGRDIVLPVRESEYDPESMDGIYFLYKKDKKLFYKLLRTYFGSDNFKQDADFAKVIAWTNKCVNTFNEIIRKMIYGSDIDKLVVGEKLIANKPIMDDEGQMIFNNNDEFEVVSITTGEKLYKMHVIKYYVAIVKYIGLDGEVDRPIKIVHEESEEHYLAIVEHLAEVAKSHKKGSYEAAGAWKDMYKFKENFADVNYNYAITGHKSQGSGYENVFVIESDVDNNRKVKERNRIKYTAFTRSTKKLFVIE